jgi:hypothetical protein
MSTCYISEVPKFGGRERLTNSQGRTFNISNADDFPSSEVVTDVFGNITKMPLLWRKPCFARPERYIRGNLPNTFKASDGEQRWSKTSCNGCYKNTLGVFEACGMIVSQRVSAVASISTAFDEWIEACEGFFGRDCYRLSVGRLWQSFLQAIIDSGGWTSVNDDQVTIESLRIHDQKKKDRARQTKVHRVRLRAARKGVPFHMSSEWLAQLQTARDARAVRLKDLRCLSGRTTRDMLWLKNLPDDTCDRIADVWQHREYLLRCGAAASPLQIVERLTGDPKYTAMKLSSLRTRVYEDIRRLKKLEADLSGSPLWPQWKAKDKPPTD